VYLLVCVSLILLGFSCSSNNGSTKQETQAQIIKSDNIDPITIKGFSLGMDYSKAREQAFKLFEENGYSKEIKTDITPESTDIIVYQTPDRPVVITIFKDKEEKLKKVEMSTFATNEFFKAALLSEADFVKEFTKSYGLPDLAPVKDSYMTYWKYESKKGWYIKINDAKFITFGKSPEIEKPVFD
jgi:hypothetical protein